MPVSILQLGSRITRCVSIISWLEIIPHLKFTSIKVYQEPFWGGSMINLVDTLNFGDYMYEVRDSSTNQLLYSRGFNTLFREWQTTDEATHIKKAFKQTLTFPFPKTNRYFEYLQAPIPG